VTLSELFAAIGDGDLKFQLLASCLEGSQWAPSKRKKYSRFTFATEENFDAVIRGTRVGFIVFCDKDKLEAARRNSPPTPSETPLASSVVEGKP
jgi:hypothetical protein